MAPDVESVLRAVVIGGNLLAARRGARKHRRRVPEKQERLLRLAAEHETLSFEELTQAFPKAWERITKRWEHKARILAKRELFRNVADLAARTNSALLAAYEEASRETLELTANRFLGLSFDYQTLTISWCTAKNLDALRAQIVQTSGKAHAPLTEEPSRENRVSTTSPKDLEIEVREDPVTGIWRFELNGKKVEVVPAHGLIKIDGALHHSKVVEGLAEVEELAGEPLDVIWRLLESSQSR